MRITIATRAGGLRWSLVCALLISALSIGAVGTVSGSNREPTAAASKKKKKKCKKALWKCAPKDYHLSVDAVVKFATGSQVSTAEVNMGKRRASVGQVQYTQGGGTVTVRATWTSDFSE